MGTNQSPASPPPNLETTEPFSRKGLPTLILPETDRPALGRDTAPAAGWVSFFFRPLLKTGSEPHFPWAISHARLGNVLPRSTGRLIPARQEQSPPSQLSPEHNLDSNTTYATHATTQPTHALLPAQRKRILEEENKRINRNSNDPPNTALEKPTHAGSPTSGVPSPPGVPIAANSLC